MKKIGTYFLTFFIILFLICLILFSKSNIESVHSSIDLFLNALFPTLFPFLIATELLSYTFVFSFLQTNFGRIMRPLFNINNIGAYPLVVSLFSSAPVGARIVSDLRHKDLITKTDGELLLILTNNVSPLFIIVSVGIGIYGSKSIGFLLYFVHIFSALITVFLFGKLCSNNLKTTSFDNTKYISLSSVGEIISRAIKKAFVTLSIVCGFIILFSLICSMLESSKLLNFIAVDWLKFFILGTLEMTNGIYSISLINMTLYFKLLLTSFLLGFGGFSVLLQVWSVISDTDLSIKPFVLGKCFNSFFSILILLILLKV